MNKQKGFTLVEAAIAIGVVSILSGIIIPLVLKNIRDAQVARARNDLQVIAGAIASQMKDMGTLPHADAGNNGTGVGDAIWQSDTGQAATLSAQIVAANNQQLTAAQQGQNGIDLARNHNTFSNLFSQPASTAAAHTLFGFDGQHIIPHQGYQGPYLGADACAKTDPWGRPYYIFGYNASGMAANHLPIWIVSAGPKGVLDRASILGAAHEPAAAWDNGNGNIALRIN